MKQKKNTPRQPKPVYTRKEPQGPRIIASKYVASAVRPDQYPEGDMVDLPGYGYAKTDKSNRNIWSSFIADYILQSERLMLLCLLVDGRHPELPIDQEAFNWLREAGVPLQIVVTKVDKLNSKERQQNMRFIKENFPCEAPAIPYSSLKHTGRELLLKRINQVIVGVDE